MAHALEGYALLIVTGKGQRVDDLRKMLGFARGRAHQRRPLLWPSLR